MAVVTVSFLGVKYLYLTSGEIVAPDTFLNALSIFKQRGSIYAYALTDAMGSIVAAARSGAIDGFLQGLTPELRKIAVMAADMVSAFNHARRS